MEAINEITDIAAVRIEKAGLLDTLQDGGRYGHRSQGVPVSGAMDDFSYTVGNLLLANERNAASLEFTLIGPRLRFSHSTQIVITGADLSPRINDKPVELWQPLNVCADDQITFSHTRDGCRTYLSIKGGFHVPLVLGSASTYIKGQIGGTHGQRLRVGDSIHYTPQEFNKKIEYSKNILAARSKSLSHVMRPQINNNQIVELRVVAGPQSDYFSAEGLQRFFTETFVVSKEMDRMGIRLLGNPIDFACTRSEKEIITDVVTYGAIQVPADGQLVILGTDSQTTGGYAKIGCIISVDLPKVAQLQPFQTVCFTEVSLEFAQEKYRKLQIFFAVLEKSVRN